MRAFPKAPAVHLPSMQKAKPMIADRILQHISGKDRPIVAVGIDASGCFSTAAVDYLSREVDTAGRKTDAEIHVILFDHQIISQTKLKGPDFAAEIRQLAFDSRGGTSFIEVISRAAQLNPSVLVMLTDLYGQIGDAPGEIPVIWASPDVDPPAAPFGEVISIFHTIAAQ